MCILLSGVSFEFCICWICKLDCTDTPVVATRLPRFLPCWGGGDILTRHCMSYLHAWNGISQSFEHDFDDTEPLFDKSYSQKCFGNYTAGAFKAVPPGAPEVRRHHCSTRLVCLDEQSKFLSFMAAEYQVSALRVLHHTNNSKDYGGTGWGICTTNYCHDELQEWINFGWMHLNATKLKKNTVYRSLSHRPTVILYLSFRLATKFSQWEPQMSEVLSEVLKPPKWWCHNFFGFSTP